MTLLFPELGSVHAALLADLLPTEVLEKACAYGRIGKGIWIHTETSVPTRGLTAERIERPGPGTPALCWAEVLPTQTRPPPTELQAVLFVLPAPQLLALAGELLRLGCDRQRWAIQGDTAYLRAVEPPWYTVLAHSEHGQVYREERPDLWVELHTQHPLLHHLRPDTPLLIRAGHPWQNLPAFAWTDLYQALQLHLDGTEQAHAPAAIPRLEVHLRLVPGGHQDDPVFWLLTERPLEQLEALLARVPQKTLEPLRFAATEGEHPLVLLRAPNARSIADLGLRARAFAPLLSLPNTFRPVHTTLEPPLRQDAIRNLLASQPYEVTWIEPSDTGVAVHRIHQNAFRPLTDWVDYIVQRSERALVPWLESSTFAFQEWTDLGREWADVAPDSPAKPTRERPKRESAPRPQRQVRTATERTLPKRERVAVVADQQRDAVITELTAIETRFSALDSGPEAQERTPLWTQMATLLRRLGRDREARLAWAQAAWHTRDPAIASEWAAEELDGLEPPSIPLEPQNAWALAACLLAGARAPSPELATWFDRHDSELDARTAWSVRELLAEGDELALARARDVLLARLRRGLVRGVDVPSFLGRVDAGTRETLNAHLTAQHLHFQKTKRSRSVLEAPEVLTQAYVDLVFAWGYASLGSREQATRLRDVRLDLDDPIHGALVGAYQARIDQALQGVPREAPLPPEATARLQALAGLQKYKVDRLRSASGILEPRERLDPFRGYTLEGTEQASDLQRLSGDALRNALEDLSTRAATADSLHQFFLALPSQPVSVAAELLDRIELGHLPPEERLPLHTDAVVAAGLLGQRTLAQRHAAGLQEALADVSSEQLADATRSLVQAFRGLRRLGLQDLATTSLERVLGIASGKRFVDQLTRAAAAGGLALCGDSERAVPLLDAALEVASKPFDRPVDQQRMVRTLALSLSSAPRDVALERLPALAALLSGITDSFNTNSHFCFTVVDFAESIVLGYSDRQLLQDPRTRTFLLDDEFLLRSRIA